MTWGANKSLGEIHILVLRLIESGKATTLPAIRAGLKHRTSGDNIPAMLAMLNRRGLVVQTGGSQYLVTKAGRKLLPVDAPPQEAGATYVPPSFAPARAGALDYARYPSVAAGVRRPYHAEGIL